MHIIIGIMLFLSSKNTSIQILFMRWNEGWCFTNYFSFKRLLSKCR